MQLLTDEMQGIGDDVKLFHAVSFARNQRMPVHFSPVFMIESQKAFYSVRLIL